MLRRWTVNLMIVLAGLYLLLLAIAAVVGPVALGMWLVTHVTLAMP